MGIFIIMFVVCVVWSLMGIMIDRYWPNLRFMKNSTVWFIVVGPVAWGIVVCLVTQRLWKDHFESN